MQQHTHNGSSRRSAEKEKELKILENIIAENSLNLFLKGYITSRKQNEIKAHKQTQHRKGKKENSDYKGKIQEKNLR